MKNKGIILVVISFLASFLIGSFCGYSSMNGRFHELKIELDLVEQENSALRSETNDSIEYIKSLKRENELYAEKLKELGINPNDLK